MPADKEPTVEITVQQLVEELAALGLAVHVELAKQRIANRLLAARLAEAEAALPEPPAPSVRLAP